MNLRVILYAVVILILVIITETVLSVEIADSQPEVASTLATTRDWTVIIGFVIIVIVAAFSGRGAPPL